MSNKSDSQPAYFLSLEVENVRCFGPRQTLDVSNGNGRPAQWTVILGDNGVGKTTLLQCLVGMEPFPLSDNNKARPRYFELFSPHHWYQLQRQQSSSMVVLCSVFLGAKLTEPQKAGKVEFPFGLGPDHNQYNEVTGSYPQMRSLVCYGYGASRRMRESTHVTEKEDNTGNWDTLFDEDTPLGNAEEWLLKTQLNAKSATPEVSKKFEQQLTEVIAVLRSILPDIQDIRIPQLIPFWAEGIGLRAEGNTFLSAT